MLEMPLLHFGNISTVDSTFLISKMLMNRVSRRAVITCCWRRKNGRGVAEGETKSRFYRFAEMKQKAGQHNTAVSPGSGPGGLPTTCPVHGILYRKLLQYAILHFLAPTSVSSVLTKVFTLTNTLPKSYGPISSSSSKLDELRLHDALGTSQ